MDDDNYFMEYISKRYDSIKNEFRGRIVRMGLVFDDDIFSDTIIRCNEKLSREKPNDKCMLSYFWRSFKLNTLRDLSYSRNKNTNVFPELRYDPDDTVNEDFDIISDEICRKFGEETYKLFVLHANGSTYDELYNISGKKNLKYLLGE